VNPGSFQANPHPLACDYRRLQGLHGSIMIAGLADGSVRAIDASISALTFTHIASPSGGEVLGSDW
jgi:hypothetical protein